MRHIANEQHIRQTQCAPIIVNGPTVAPAAKVERKGVGGRSAGAAQNAIVREDTIRGLQRPGVIPNCAAQAVAACAVTHGRVCSADEPIGQNQMIQRQGHAGVDL